MTMTSLKHHFLKNLWTDSSETFVGDVKFMPNKVPKVLRRYLSLFWSYRENTVGGGYLHSQWGAG